MSKKDEKVSLLSSATDRSNAEQSQRSSNSATQRTATSGTSASTKETLASTTEKEKVSKRPTPPKKSDGREFEKGPCGWLFSVGYLLSVWGFFGLLTVGIIILLLTRVSELPLYYGKGTFIGGTPRVVFEPNPARYDLGARNVFHFNASNKDTYINFLIRYKKILEEEYASSAEDCGSKIGAMDGQQTKEGVCRVDRDNRALRNGFGPCALTINNIESGMGFPKGSPCIMLRLTKLLGWFPTLNNKAITANTSRSCADGSKKCCQTQRITFTCTGDEVEFAYFPKDGMESCGYPYWNQPNYQQPFVMVQVHNVTHGKNVIICKSDLPNMHQMDDGESNEAHFIFDRLDGEDV